jgi:hypothetical protein
MSLALSMEFGFLAVGKLAAVIYAIAWLCLRGNDREGPSPTGRSSWDVRNSQQFLLSVGDVAHALAKSAARSK